VPPKLTHRRRVLVVAIPFPIEHWDGIPRFC
jgi:hypothetical protein